MMATKIVIGPARIKPPRRSRRSPTAGDRVLRDLDYLRTLIGRIAPCRARAHAMDATRPLVRRLGFTEHTPQERAHPAAPLSGAAKENFPARHEHLATVSIADLHFDGVGRLFGLGDHSEQRKVRAELQGERRLAPATLTQRLSRGRALAGS